MCPEVLTAGPFRKGPLPPKELGPFLPSETFLELLEPGSYMPTEKATHGKEPDKGTLESSADPLPACPWTSAAGGCPSPLEAGLNSALLLLVAEIMLAITATVKILGCNVPKRAKDVKVI